MPKVKRNGQAVVLSDAQLATLFATLAQPQRLVFQICYYTAARVGEVVQLQAEDVVAGRIVYRARTTKTKTTRDVAIVSPLVAALKAVELPQSGYLFPGRFTNHLTTQATDKALRQACDYLGFRGVSTQPLIASGDRCSRRCITRGIPSERCNRSRNMRTAIWRSTWMWGSRKPMLPYAPSGIRVMREQFGAITL